MNKNDLNLERVLRLSRLMLHLAEEGEAGMPDVRDRVVFGVLRDSAYQLRALASSRLDEYRRRTVETGVETTFTDQRSREIHHPWN